MYYMIGGGPHNEPFDVDEFFLVTDVADSMKANQITLCNMLVELQLNKFNLRNLA